MKAVVASFNQEEALLGAFDMIVKTDGSFAALLSTHAELEATDADARGCSGARQPDEVTRPDVAGEQGRAHLHVSRVTVATCHGRHVSRSLCSLWHGMIAYQHKVHAPRGQEVTSDTVPLGPQ